MKAIGNKTVFETLDPRLVRDDDHELWRLALSVLLDEFELRRTESSQRGAWAIVVGACSHWVRPHNSRWNAAGGFAFPSGYKDSVPELDWSRTFISKDGELVPVEKLQGKKVRVFRVAIPTRTARHRQAAIHTRLTPHGETVLYGFRKMAEKWKYVAASDEKSKGRILLNS